VVWILKCTGRALLGTGLRCGVAQAGKVDGTLSRLSVTCMPG